MATGSSSTGVGAGATAAAGASASRHPKLDGVLYHFYSKTSAVITSCRLTHFEGVDAALAGSRSSTSLRQQSLRQRTSTDSPSNTSIQTTGRGSATGRRPSKWFALEIDDQDVFRDEIRLWRNISSLVPDWLLDSPPSVVPHEGQAYVPSMIIDVILDTSALSKKHVLMIDEVEPDGRTARRVRADGRDTDPNSSRRPSYSAAGDRQRGAIDDEPLDDQRQSIVLETWRLDFAIHNPPDPPDLPALYKEATAHFRDLHDTIRGMPSYALNRRLKQAWDSSVERQKARAAEVSGSGEGSDQKPRTDDDDDDYGANLLKIGVRLAIGRSPDSKEGEIGVSVPMGSIKHAADGTADVTTFDSFDPILTPIGSLNLSVEYRWNPDFYVEDWHVIKSLQEVALDEDYFKPTVTRHLQRQASSQQSPLSSSPASQHAVEAGGSARSPPPSLLSSTSHQRQHAGPSVVPGVSTPPVQEPTSARSIPTAIGNPIGSSGMTSGRPVAGLSSLRASPSVAGYSASPTTAAALASLGTSSGTSSPALAAALTSDAAFLTHARRSSSSASERRLRTLNMLSGPSGTAVDKDSPPSPVTTTTHVAGRPILSRATVSAVSGGPRTGSYSPSSPSPLTQQLYAQQSAALLASTASHAGRYSSSPSYRGTAFAHSISPNLRSVFQTYTPSHSQTSASSLSRTPPRSLLEGQPSSSSIAGGQAALRSRTSTELVGGGAGSAGSGSGFAMHTSRQPTVAPQMIKRYSSTFNYRQGRHGSYLGSDGSSAGGAAGTGDSGLYSKSWQARIEQRHVHAARSLGTDESAHLSGRRRHPSLADSMDQEDDLDDFVRMIDSRPSLTAADDSSAALSGAERVAATTPEARLHQQHGSSAGASASSRASPMHVSAAKGFPRNYGLNRQQVDEMLSKMEHSVRDLGSSLTTSRSSPASGGAATSSSGAHSHGGEPTATHANVTTNTAAPPPSTSFTRSPLSRGAFSASSMAGASSARQATAMQAIASGDGRVSETPSLVPSPHSKARSPLTSSPPSVGGTVSRQSKNSSSGRSAAAYDDGGLPSSNIRSAEEAEATSPEAHDSQEEVRTSRSYPGRHASRGSLDELYGGTPRSYDPLDDEAAGRLELANEEPSGVLSGRPHARSQPQPPQHQHQHPHPHTYQQHRQHTSVAAAAAATSPAADEEAARQRQSDYELARNFTQTVSLRGGNGRATVAGRTSLSPWRQRGFHLASTGGGAATNYGAAATSTTPAHSPSNAAVLEGLSAAHYYHQQLAARHASSGGGGHQHGVAGASTGSRSGQASAGPTSRAASPSID